MIKVIRYSPTGGVTGLGFYPTIYEAMLAVPVPDPRATVAEFMVTGQASLTTTHNPPEQGQETITFVSV